MEHETRERKSKNIVVLGAGNLGQAMAAHLSKHGYNVNLGNRTVSKLKPLVDNNGIIYLTEGSSTTACTLNYVGGDYQKLVVGRKFIMVCCPAPGQRFFIEKVANFLVSGQHIILHPGQLFGALEVALLLRSLCPAIADQIIISELESSLITCRADKIGHVTALGIKQKLGFATLPTTHANDLLEALEPYETCLQKRPNVLATGLSDLNLIAHPIVTMLNTGAIERGAQFLYYHDGVSEHVGTVLTKADAERLAVSKALELTLPSFKEWLIDEYSAFGAKGETTYEVIHSNHVYDTIWSPAKLYTRYIWEDVPYGLMGLIELGKQVNVDTPVLSCVYQLATIMFDTTWEGQSRSLKSLGLDELSTKELVLFAETGLLPPSLTKALTPQLV